MMYQTYNVNQLGRSYAHAPKPFRQIGPLHGPPHLWPPLPRPLSAYVIL